MLNCFHFGLSGWHVGKFASRIWMVAVASLLPPSLAFAAGLGKISVLSALGQPLRAEIEIVSLQRGEGDSLAARLASGETFRQSSIELNPALLSVKFAVERRSGGQFTMTLTSTQPMNEPFIDMLVELNWSNGRLVREYTFLLDPPEYAGPPKAEPAPAIQGAQVEALPPVAAVDPGTPGDSSVQAAAAEPAASVLAQALPETAQATQSVPADAPAPGQAGQPVSPEPTVVVDAAPGPEGAPSQAGEASSGASVQVDSAPPAQAPASELIQEPGVSHAYEVKRGDTLSKIVLGNKIEGASLQQMLVAMFRANPHAFVGDNMNRLRAGKILNIPDRDASTSVAAADARRVVSAQFADFNDYKRKLGGAVAAAPGPQEGNRQASGQIGAPKADGPTPKDAPKDQLRLSGANDAKRGTGTKAAAGSVATADDLAAKDNALREANERIALLEKNLQDLQKLSQIRSQAGAQLQQQAAGKQPEPAAKAPQAVELAKTAPAAKAAEPAKAPLPATAEAPKPVEVSKAEQPVKAPEPAKAAEAAKAPDAPKATEASKASPELSRAAEPGKAEAVAKAPVPTKSGAAKAPAAALPEPSFVDELLDNPVALGGAGGAVLLLAGYAAYAWRRKRSTQFESSVMSVSPSDADSVLGAAGGRNVDTGSSSFQSDFSQSGVAKVDTEEIDPIAEADVYMAYGRDAQAEEILKEALTKDSSRQAIRVKLLEIYANRKDTNLFEKSANELRAATGGEGPEWAKVAGLGLSIDPTNPLYGGKPGPTAKVFSETAQFAAFRAPQPEPATQAESPLNIDFDIGTATSAPAMAPDFNLDAGGSSAESEPAGLDFDLGLGTSKVGSGFGEPALGEPAASDTAISIDFDLPMGDKLGQPGAPLSAAAAPSIDFGGIDFNLGSTSGDDGGKAESFKAPAVDLASISLDLGAPGGGNGSAGAAPDARWQEVATKLDLAKAYEEMGDKDGARELLKEVMKEGDSAQQQKAQTMLQAIG
jgi:pilus assembly protein FimV